MNTQQRAWSALILGVVAISASPILVRLAGVPGTTSAFYRVFIGFLVLVPWYIARAYRAGGLTLPTGRTRWAILAGGLFFGIDLVFWNESLMHASAASATMVANNAPLWVGLVSLFWLREKLTRWYWPGLLLALVGMAVVANGDLAFDPSQRTGLLLAAGASFCYAGYLLSTRQARSGIDTVGFMVWSLAIASAVIYPVAVAIGAPLSGFTPASWGYILVLGLFSQTIGWLAINYALGHLPASVTSVSLLGQVVLAALLAVPILGEAIRPTQIIGGTFIVVGIVLVNRR
ncbi:MAG: hypothetical protein RLZZ297_1126 [Chloroflexota bacterium]